MKITDLKSNKEIPKLLSIIADQALMSITTVLTTIVLARTYDKIDYADLVLLFSITLFVLGFQSSIISKPYAISLNDYNGNSKKDYFQFNLNLKLIFSLGVILVFPLLYYFSFDRWDGKRFFLFLLYVIAHSSYFFVRETLLSQRNTKQNLVYGIFCSIGIIVLLLFILFNEIQDVTVFLLFSSIIYLTVAFIYTIKNYEKLKTGKKKYLGYWNTNWKVGKWLLGSNIFFYLSSGAYPWLLLYLANKEDIAVFGVLISIAGLINPLLTALTSYLLPIFVRVNENFQTLRAKVGKWWFCFASLSFLLIVVGVFLAEDIIPLLFGAKYANLGIIVIFPFIVQGMNVLFQPFKIALNAIKRTDIDFWTLMPRSMITIVLGFFFVTHYGLIGVFYTKIIEGAVYQLSHYFIYRKIIIKRTDVLKNQDRL